MELARAREGRVVPKARRFELIEELRGRMDDLSLTAACEALGVSEGGYYHWRARRDAQGEACKFTPGVFLHGLVGDVFLSTHFPER